MNQKVNLSMPFKRGPDRRNSQQDTGKPPLKRLKERRTAGPNWLNLFQGIEDSVINQALDDMDVLVFPENQIILKPGDKNECIYLLLSGKLAAYFDNQFNPETAVEIKPGECIGEFSAIDGKPVSATVIVVQESRILKLTPESFWSKLMPIPGVAKNLLVSLTERIRRSNEALLEKYRKQLELQYLKQELDVARQLQAGMLPQSPLFADRTEIEIDGVMEPASEIGGDLFDAFFVDEHHLFFCVGDVSGHGIPAALFMARTISLMRTFAMTTTQPNHLLERINHQLCKGNDADMFVTLFCGFFNVHSGQLIYSNAGHNPPVLASSNGVSKLLLPKGAMIGVIPDINYTNLEIHLKPGDLLLCYTDGVTEAQTGEGEEFSEQRLLELVAANTYLSIDELLLLLRQTLREFTDNLDLTDDCTLLAMRWPTGNKPYLLS